MPLISVLERHKQMDLCYFVIRAGLHREVQFSHSYIVRPCLEKKKVQRKKKEIKDLCV